MYCYITAQVTTLAGGTSQGFADGPAMSAMFSDLDTLATDSGGNVFILDRNFLDWSTRKIRRLDWSTRIVSTPVYLVRYPSILAMFNGSIWITDDNGDVKRFGIMQFETPRFYAMFHPSSILLQIIDL